MASINRSATSLTAITASIALATTLASPARSAEAATLPAAQQSNDPGSVPPAIAAALAGTWQGTYSCPENQGQLSWHITTINHRVIVDEVANPDASAPGTFIHGFVEPRMVQYVSRWNTPHLRLTSTTGHKYTIDLTLSGRMLTGYYAHKNGCVTVSATKTS